MAKSVILTPDYVPLELILSKRAVLEELESRGCVPVRVTDVEGMSYMLTSKQELALLYAYLRGYYDYPRKVSLNELAGELGLSVSTLSELLRKAENKVMHAFMLHELPHYLCNPKLGLLSPKKRKRVAEPRAEAPVG